MSECDWGRPRGASQREKVRGRGCLVRRNEGLSTRAGRGGALRATGGRRDILPLEGRLS